MAAFAATDPYHATVATAHAAAHDLFERCEHAAARGFAELGDGPHHWRWAAAVNRDGCRHRSGLKRSCEWGSDAPAFAARAVFRREIERGAKARKEFRVVEVGSRTGAVEQA